MTNPPTPQATNAPENAPGCDLSDFCEWCHMKPLEECENGTMALSEGRFACPQLVAVAKNRIVQNRMDAISRVWPMPVKYAAAKFPESISGELGQIMANIFEMKMNSKPMGNAVFYGPVGVGKTWNAACCANYAQEQGLTTVFAVINAILTTLKSSYDVDGSGTLSESEQLTALIECDLLVIDDIGKQKNNEWAEDIIWQIIDGRSANMRPIIYTTEYQSKELFKSKRATALIDRIFEDATVISMKGKSRRRRK